MTGICQRNKIMSESLAKSRTNGQRFTAVKLLGIGTGTNLRLAKKVEAGISFSALERLCKTTGLSLDKLRVSLRITPRTLTRRRNEKRLSPEESDRLISVSRLLAQAFELFEGDKAAAVRWFVSPKRAFGGLMPLEMSATEVGSREVENLIGRLEHGVFS